MRASAEKGSNEHRGRTPSTDPPTCRCAGEPTENPDYKILLFFRGVDTGGRRANHHLRPPRPRASSGAAHGSAAETRWGCATAPRLAWAVVYPETESKTPWNQA